MHTHRLSRLRILNIVAAAALLLALPAQSRADDFAERMKQEQARRAQRIEAEKAEAEAKKKAAEEAFAALAPLELTIEGLNRDTFRSLQRVNMVSHPLKGAREAQTIASSLAKDGTIDAVEEQLLLALQSPTFNLTLRPAADAGIPVKEINFAGSFTDEGKAVFAALVPAPDSRAYEIWLTNLGDAATRKAMLNTLKKDESFRERALRHAAAQLDKAWQSPVNSQEAYKKQLEQWAPIGEINVTDSGYDWRTGGIWLYEVILLHNRISGNAVPGHYYLRYAPAPAEAAKAQERIDKL